MNTDILKRAGIDYDSGLDRFMGDAELYETVLAMFLDDCSLQKAGDARAKGDYPAMFEAMHELKGVAGNEDMTDLYKASCELVELLRGGSDYDYAAIDRSFDEVSRSYAAAKAGILDAGRA